MPLAEGPTMGGSHRVIALVAGGLIAALLGGCAVANPVANPEAPPSETSQQATNSPPGPPEPTAALEPTKTTIVTEPADAVVGIYGTRTSATFAVGALGRNLRYAWQQRAAAGGKWRPIKGAKSAAYTARARKWPDGTQFRVIVTGDQGKLASKPATLTVLAPTNTPAKDAERAFGLTGLRQGLDLSAYQHTRDRQVRLAALKAWTGAAGFTILRTGSGDRPINYRYTDVCTGKPGKTKRLPATRDCAYRRLASKASGARLSLGHYWFNGWLDSIDPTDGKLLAGGATPTDSAALFVAWLKADGRYTRASTDPLVLDIEAGTTRQLTADDGTRTRHQLRAWTPAEATEFLIAVRDQLTGDGYHANLYVYLTGNATLAEDAAGYYVWAPVARIARLWVAAWGTNNGRLPASEPAVGPWLGRGGWSIWQYTSQARVPGSGVGALDADLAKPDAWTPRPPA